jgi:hypothetical protein
MGKSINNDNWCEKLNFVKQNHLKNKDIHNFEDFSFHFLSLRKRNNMSKDWKKMFQILKRDIFDQLFDWKLWFLASESIFYIRFTMKFEEISTLDVLKYITWLVAISKPFFCNE